MIHPEIQRVRDEVGDSAARSAAWGKGGHPVISPDSSCILGSCRRNLWHVACRSANPVLLRYGGGPRDNESVGAW